jgi:hypothetical protein
MSRPTELPERPCSLVTHAAGRTVSFSRWQGGIFLDTWGGAAELRAALMAGLRAQGLEPVVVEDWRWRLAGEAEARRAMRWSVEQATDLARIELCLVAANLPGVCSFRFDLQRDGEVHVAPELEFHRDEQRARVPRAETWLEAVLSGFDATPVWTAEWRITRARMLELLAGPMDPFLRPG